MKNKRIHNFTFAVLLTFLVWVFVNAFIMEITLKQFVIIEICMATCEVFSNFVKEKMGLISEDQSPKSS